MLHYSSPRKKRKRGAQFKIELAEEPQADLRELFELFDKDGDGQLSREEIGEMVRTSETR
jgi:Ca2+-binding EF-hand superfamily protein